MYEKEIEYIKNRLTDIGLISFYTGFSNGDITFSHTTYQISLNYINYNNLKCSFSKTVYHNTMIGGSVLSSSIISDWQKYPTRIGLIDNWLENILIIPEVKILLRNSKLEKIIRRCE